MASAAEKTIDLVHLAHQSGGDPALESELLALFAAQCARQLGEILDRSRQTGQRRDAAHTLKGAARAVGAWEVAEAADEVETALRAGRDIGLDRMIAATDAARRLIEEWQSAA